MTIERKPPLLTVPAWTPLCHAVRWIENDTAFMTLENALATVDAPIVDGSDFASSQKSLVLLAREGKIRGKAKIEIRDRRSDRFTDDFDYQPDCCSDALIDRFHGLLEKDGEWLSEDYFQLSAKTWDRRSICWRTNSLLYCQDGFELSYYEILISGRDLLKVFTNATDFDEADEVQESVVSTSPSAETRRNNTMLKIIAGMAYDTLGWRPNVRGPAAKEIEDATARIGARVSADTVRTILNEASEFLDITDLSDRE